MVFQTTPPHPASKARCTCAPELAGGAEASQKGLGDRIPAKSIRRSAIRVSFPVHDAAMDRDGSQLAVLNRHHRRSRVHGSDAVAARIDGGHACLEVSIHPNKALFGLEAQLL